MDRIESYKGPFVHGTACEATNSSCIQLSGTLARALDTVKGAWKGVSESADLSVEVLRIWQPTGVDISDRSRASSLPIGYSSLPSVVERLPQVSSVEGSKP